MRLSEETQQANKFENIVEGNNHTCNMVDGNITMGFLYRPWNINMDMLKPNTKYLVWLMVPNFCTFMDKLVQIRTGT